MLARTGDGGTVAAALGDDAAPLARAEGGVEEGVGDDEADDADESGSNISESVSRRDRSATRTAGCAAGSLRHGDVDQALPTMAAGNICQVNWLS